MATPSESHETEAGNEGALWSTAVLDVADPDADKRGQVYAFGRDADGEVDVLASGSESGGLHRVGPAE